MRLRRPPVPWVAALAALDRIEDTLENLTRKVDRIMSDQSHIDADVTELETAVGAIADEIATLKQNNPGVDFSGLDKAVSDVANLAPAATTTAAAPADQTAPAAGDQPTA